MSPNSSATEVPTPPITPEKFTESDFQKGVPRAIPSILELKKALPAHCFQPDLTTSFYYAFKDLALVAGLYIIMLAMELQPYTLLKWAYIPIYWYVSGTLMASIFIVGHDCGHESFSNNSLINDIVGNFMHTIILVPYYPWKLSHRHHHKNTGNIDKDEVFYPVREQHRTKDSELMIPYFGLGIGWIFYMFKGYSPRTINHFNPFNHLFIKHSVNCIISMACLTAWMGLVVIPYGSAYGFSRLAIHYLMPVFGFMCWIVFITFLHHHDENVPWYGDEKWDFVRGQLSSVDRNYGWAHDVLHNIGTHQIHHLFSKVPHYHLEEATKVFRERYPELVRKSDERLIPAFIRIFHMFMDQVWIPDDAQVHSYTLSNKSL
uniref:Methyl-end desaturase 1 n=1 Tax=Tigriopus californicus TaxID=6832 RepID=A0A8E8LH69_TIGCA|nr:methyl-end desaturase 1 [Tigriopus californicus]